MTIVSDILALAIENLLSPAILFFVLGAVAAAVRSDLEIPPEVGKGLSLYLLISIGFTGGLKLGASAWTGTMVAVGVSAIAFGFIVPLIAYRVLCRITDEKRSTLAAVAASFGSISAVTFVTAVAFLERESVPFAGYLIAVMALMEFPAVVSGLMLARREGRTPPKVTEAATGGMFAWFPGAAFREALVSGSVLLLLGGLAIGMLTGEAGKESVGNVLVTPFKGILALFLLEMGLIVVRRFRRSTFMGWPLFFFGLYMPLVGATIALVLARIIGLGQGDATLLAVLFASASYIAVPAAFRHALPQADPSKYVTLALGITFPFNVIVGIPLYYAVAGWLLPA